MNDDRALHALAQEAGLLIDWVDAADQQRRVAVPTLRTVLGALGLPAANARQCEDSLRQCQDGLDVVPLLTTQRGTRFSVGAPGTACEWQAEDGGRIAVQADDQGDVVAPNAIGYWMLHHQGRAQRVAVAPLRCFGVADACGDGSPRAWGVGLQVYSARQPDDAGIGDVEAAATWVRQSSLAGADAMALGPVHAARPVDQHYSPYSPSDRRYFDPLHAAPVRVLGEAALQAMAQVEGLGQRFSALHRQAMIDWPASAAAKWEWLKVLHRELASMPAACHADFARFVDAGGESLRAYATFAAGDFGDDDPALQLFAQWLAARGWAGLQREARERGMAIGLIADLAVGFDPAGAEAAAWPDAVMHGLVLGAPPDAFNAAGQQWGIGSYSPVGLRRSGYAPFLSLLRAVMRDRGGVRIDHILGLLRLWVVPEGADTADGAYLRYPLHDLLNLLALESWRHRAVVIGEDLGVVPPGIRAELSQRGVMGIDVLMFTRDYASDGHFLAPSEWRRDAVATTTTHDLPTVVGWRQARDLDWRARLGMAQPEELREARAQRKLDIEALERAKARAAVCADDPWLGTLCFTARAPAPLALLPVEDALALIEQPNLPGTVAVHPNWCRRLPDPLPQATLHRALVAFSDARRAAHAEQERPLSR